MTPRYPCSPARRARAITSAHTRAHSSGTSVARRRLAWIARRAGSSPRPTASAACRRPSEPSKAATSSATIAGQAQAQRFGLRAYRPHFVLDRLVPFLPMDTLQTMDTSAAPMAPMMAAALPPPGVGSPLASRSRNSSIELCVITGVPCRRRCRGDERSADHRLGESVDLLGIEQQVVLLEQTRDACAVQGELQGAEAERTEKDLAVA